MKATAKGSVNATKTIQLLSNEVTLISTIKKGMQFVEDHSLKGLQKSIAVGRKINELRSIWDDRLKLLYKEEGTDWKGFISSVTGKDYSWCQKLKNAATIADSKASLVDAFIADAKALGLPVSIEGLIRFASGNKPKKGSGKSDPSDLIRFEGLEIKFKEGKFELAKGSKGQVDRLIKFLQGVKKEL